MKILSVTRRGLADRLVVVGDHEYAVYYCDASLDGQHGTCGTNNVPFLSDVHWLAQHISQWAADGCTIKDVTP